MNKRNLRLDKYGISSKRYKELCGFCEQYPEWKKSMEDYAYLPGRGISGMPKSPTPNTSSPVEEAALKMDRWAHNCALIEETAKAVDADCWMAIIKSVCYNVSVTYLTDIDHIPMEKSAFYERRRYFFFLLDRKKQ